MSVLPTTANTLPPNKVTQTYLLLHETWPSQHSKIRARLLRQRGTLDRAPRTGTHKM